MIKTFLLFFIFLILSSITISALEIHLDSTNLFLIGPAWTDQASATDNNWATAASQTVDSAIMWNISGYITNATYTFKWNAATGNSHVLCRNFTGTTEYAERIVGYLNLRLITDASAQTYSVGIPSVCLNHGYMEIGVRRDQLTQYYYEGNLTYTLTVAPINLSVYDSITIINYTNYNVTLNLSVCVYNDGIEDFNTSSLLLDSRFGNGSETIDLVMDSVVCKSYSHLFNRTMEDRYIIINATNILHDSGVTYNVSGDSVFGDLQILIPIDPPSALGLKSSNVSVAVGGHSAVNLVSNSSVVEQFYFNITGSVNESSGLVVLSKVGESNISCSSCSFSSNIFNCSVSLPYYTSSGSWFINSFVSDNSDVVFSNKSVSFTVNSLDSVGLNDSVINWVGLSPGSTYNEGDSLKVYNFGNTVYSVVSVTGSDAVSGVNTIFAQNFSVDVNSGQVGGTDSLLNGSSVSLSGGSLGVGVGVSEVVFSYLSLGLVPSGDYVSVSDWGLSLS